MLDSKDPYPDTWCKAADLHSLLRCAVAAEENETSGFDWKGTNRVLDIAERLAFEIMEEVEMMQRKMKGGEN